MLTNKFVQRAAFICALPLLLLSCVGKSQADSAASLPVAVRVGSFGIACKSYAYPTSLGPPSFSVRDIGKPHVPPLTDRHRSMVMRIRRYVASGYLRFAFLGSPRNPHAFIVFDAIYGPCYSGAGGYAVLNGCANEIYEPGEDPRSIKAASTDIYTTPGPWMSGYPLDPICGRR